MKRLSRRDFLKYASLGVAGGYLGLKASPTAAMHGSGGGGGGGMGGGGTQIIDPPPGAPFMDLPTATNVSADPSVVEVSVEARAARINVNGTMADLLTYNGHYPGPTIRVKNTQTLRLQFRNSLPQLGTNILGHDRSMTNIHTHGLHVSPMGNADNVMMAFMPGDTFAYEYDLSKHAPGNLNLYHPHIHGTVAEQVWAGMMGALLVEDETTALNFETHVMMLTDISLSGAAPEPHDSMMDFMHGLEGNIVMVNGQVNPVLSIRPGQVQRWRIVNASTARFYKLSLEGHTLNVVGTDGGLLDKPYPNSYFLLSPGERLDILVKGNLRKGKYRLLSLAYDRGGMGGGQQVTLLTLSVDGSRASDAIPSIVNPGAVRATAQPVKTEQIILSMGQGKGYVNGISFDGVNAYAVHSDLDTWEVWEISNSSGMDHPFHQHTHPCQVLSISGGDSAYASFMTKAPAWKDTFIIPKWGSARILLPIMDYDGMAMFHCHILEHEDIGMLGVWHVMEMM